MIEIIIILAILDWLLCGVIAFGFYFAYFQNKYPEIAEETRAGDYENGIMLSLCGPMSLIATLIECRGYGWKLK